MSDRYDKIDDDELRVIGGSTTDTGRRTWLWAVLAAAAVLLVGVAFLTRRPVAADGGDDELSHAAYEPSSRPADAVRPSRLGSTTPDDIMSYTERLDTTVNDIPLDILIPHNAVPELVIGMPDSGSTRIILAAMAADVRADNGKIVGAFVLGGEPLAWGLSKKGYCGIIEGRITVGVAENSPLFEEATEKGGHFFRQYPLVDDGRLVDNEPKNKSIRKALCDRGGEIMVIMSRSAESFHDFAQALVDLGVDNAVYLVGGSTGAWYRGWEGTRTELYPTGSRHYENDNYIIWKRRFNDGR